MAYRIPSGEIPVLYEADVVVIGGSFAGISGALRLASSGKHVVIIEPRTYLGSELTASLRPWLEQSDAANAALPDLIKQVLEGNSHTADGHMPLHPDRLKRDLEDVLENNHIEWLYATLPIQIMEQSGHVTGIVVANKSGRQAIRCPAIIDATDTAVAAALAGEPVSQFQPGHAAIYVRTLEFTNVAPLDQRTLAVPERLNIPGNQVSLRHGYRGTGHMYVQYAMEMSGENSLRASREREGAARHLGMRLASWLIHEVPAFGKATLAAGSHELAGPYASLADTTAVMPVTPDFDHMALRLAGVICLGKALWQGQSALLDAVQAANIGAHAAEHVLQSACFISEPPVSVRGAEEQPHHDGDAEVQVHVPSWIAAERYETRTRVPSAALPVLKQADVLVVGGGTSGANASFIAAGEGMDTMLLELNPGLGGTGTFGGVDSYWFGMRTGYAAAIAEKVETVQQEIRYKGHKWNIEAKMEALLREGDRAGADMLFNVITFGAITRGNRLCGAVIATRWGPYSVGSKVVIDATGDGDIAAYAGAEYVYGSVKDSTVMWYSLAQYKSPDKLQNNFTSMVDVSDIHDYTRAIRAGRRRGTDCHDHGIYVATRESRHVAGDVVMQLTDQLLQRKWPDVINIHFSNHDVKGVSGADWVNVGMIPPNLEIEIPYRMLLPQGLEGILVVGKAISATHDALPAIRMQSDLENLGGAAALAASIAVRTDEPPRMINVEELQARLIREGLIPASVRSRTLSPRIYTDQELEQLVESIEVQPLYDYPNMRMNEVYRRTIPFVEICSAGSRMIPVLERALEAADGPKKIRIAQALAMLASNKGNAVLSDAIFKELSGPELPIRTAEMMYVQLPPDHGAMPDAAYLLYALAQAPDADCVPVWQRVADLLLPDEEAFKDMYKGIFYFVDAVCRGAERLGDQSVIPVLERMHGNPLFNGQQCDRDSGVQPDYFLERRAMLELAIGRALARCGSPQGYSILIAYLQDRRSLLSRNAWLALKDISGQHFAREAALWQQWVEEQRPYERTYPYTARLDIEEDSASLLRVES